MNYFIVFQNKTYVDEKRHGMLWAPKHTSNGKEIFHWSNMTKLLEGDVVFSMSRREIKAVNVVTRRAYESPRPQSFDTNLWNKNGWRADLEYYELNNPIPIDSIFDGLKPLLP